ncbi:Uu.00g063610.m01.CDS01 [Anthostomella pinea]|uniref:Uu.00g063610.m01.CDS01 n=1 Tax=Anthostomella pinea TaxID=933095 RepID=A0AAI8VMU4_9PEZI|nr:Uu.00g063610.m01.CDS01 [Anthostomella pinea]
MAGYNQVPDSQSGDNAFANNFANNPFEYHVDNPVLHGSAYNVQPIAGPPAQDGASHAMLPGLEERSCLGHAGVHDASGRVLECIKCSWPFSTNGELRKHGKQKGHSPYGCTCGQKFTRHDTLKRHISENSANALQYPCHYCDRHTGDQAFKRADHLTQHLRVYHHVDTVDKLFQDRASKSSSPQGPVVINSEFFQNQAPEWYPVPAVANNEPALEPMPPFPCLVPGCPKWGDLGYLRQVDLDEHQALVHGFGMQNYETFQLPFNQNGE